VDGFLAQLAKRLRVPDADIVTGDEIRDWPDGRLEELLAERVLQEIEHGTTVVCDQCDEHCPIEPQMRTDPQTDKAVGVYICMREEVGGRMEIDLDRLRKWQIDKRKLWKLVYGFDSEWEVPWDDDVEAYIPLQEAVNLASDDSITVRGMSRLLEDPEFPVHRMHRGRRCKVHLSEFRGWLKYAQGGKVTDKAIEKYLRGSSERKQKFRQKKSRVKGR
jgi:hypothetical protein